jgi:hypothetical protein
METQEATKPKRKPMDGLPEPKKILSALLLVGILAVVIKFWPLIIVSVFGDYSQKNAQDLSPVLFALFGVIAVLVLLLISVWNVRGIWWPFLRASWTNSIVLMAFTKNKLISFVIPKEVNWNHIRIDGESTIDPDPESRYTAPNKVPVLPFIPDHAKTFDPRALILNSQKDLSIDINTLDNIGTLNLIKGMKKMTNPLGSLMNSGILWVGGAILILLLVMWPQFSQQMDNSSKVSQAQSVLLQCNQALVANGIKPVGIDMPTPSTTTTLPQNVAVPGGQVKSNPNSIGGN